MITLDGNISLPLPRKAKGFKRLEDISERKWREVKLDMWKRAYQHCLYSLHLVFELPLHSVVPRISKKMLEASDPFNVALRFIGEMELAGYLRLERGFDERVVMPTKKLLDLNLGSLDAPDSVVRMPIISGCEIPESPIRGGVGSKENKEIVSITSGMSKEEFKVNNYILQLIKDFPPEFDEVGSEYMFNRTMKSAEDLKYSVFSFPYFLCSRSRMYTDTTCGFSPQGADHEKAIIIPTYERVLTEVGCKALFEAATGYAEKEWLPSEMILHASNPKKYEDVWKSADKPYSYMSCANLLKLYYEDPKQPLPAFIPLDGRCSGLQHWSAVTRSDFIMRHLGMHLDEADLDIYEKVAENWRDTLIPEHKMYATRKGAKIPVMTWAYNATMMTSMDYMDKLFGAKRKWCKESGSYIIVGKGLERAMAGRLGADLYRNLHKTLGALQEAVDWVTSCAAAISKCGNVEIHWPTPDGFEAMQRKVKGVRRDLDCCLSNGKRFTLQVLDFTKEVPNTAKHKSAIAPNVIHGCDAAHLRMVGRRLDDRDRPMIFIHDSFATHCNYREELYIDIVETFVEMYSINYLMQLYDYWKDRYKCKLELPPKMGDWQPSSLTGLRRFFL